MGPYRPSRLRPRSVSPAVLGFPPLDALLADDAITEIMVNGPDEVWIERGGRLHETDVRMTDAAHVRWLIDRIATPLGRRCDESTPMLEARLVDGSRVHAVLPPLSVNGPTLTIRKFPHTPLGADDLVERGSATPEVMAFLHAAVLARLNVVVSGGTGAGKTTLLNVLSSFIPDGERILTIETAAELQLQQRHVVSLESRVPDVDGRGAVTIRDLVVTALRMRPDRIVVGECRAGEALDMLQAMNTGHDGSLTTLHASSPRDAVRRLETMALMAGIELPVRAIRAQIAAAVNLSVHCERLEDGVRRITGVTEIAGMEGDVVTMSDLFVFRREGRHQDGYVRGRLTATGVRPHCLERLRARRAAFPDALH